MGRETCGASVECLLGRTCAWAVQMLQLATRKSMPMADLVRDAGCAEGSIAGATAGISRSTGVLQGRLYTGTLQRDSRTARDAASLRG